MRSLLARITARVVEQPAAVLAATLLLVLVCGAAALGLRPTADTESLVDSGSETFAQTEQFKREFGEDAVVVLARGDLQRLLLTENIQTLLALENCLAGELPAADGGEAQAGAAGQAAAGQTTAAGAVPEACAALAETRPARAVYGPAGFLQQFVDQSTDLLSQQSESVTRKAERAAVAAREVALDNGATQAEAERAAKAAYDAIYGQLSQDLLGRTFQLASEYGLTSLPSIDDPVFVSNVFFDENEVDPTPKSRFAYLVPSENAALISIRLRAELSDAEEKEAIGLIREATEDPAFALGGTDYVISGVPVLVDGVNAKISEEVLWLGGLAVIVMAFTLLALVGPPLRLLPLAIALAGSGVVFGLLQLAGGELTLASLAVMPILIGLGVDYAIQFQARYHEAIEAGATTQRASIEAAARGGPTIGAAALVTAAGFIALMLSPIPMIRSFALILVLGTLAVYAISLTAGLAALSMARRPEESRARRAEGRFAGAAAWAEPRIDRIAGRARGVLRRAGHATLGRAIASPVPVLAVAVGLAVAGWALDTRAPVVSDLRALVPSELGVIQDVDALEEETGISGEIDVTVTSDDLTDPAVVEWMAGLQERVLERGGFEPGASCVDGETNLCPAPSLPDLLSASGEIPDQETIAAVLDLLPPRFSQAVIETDPETGERGDTAVIAFGIRVQPFDQQQELIDGIRAEVEAEGGPPEGVEAAVVGLPVLAADANGELSGNRYLISGVAIALVAAILLAVHRNPRRALVPLIPIVLATGWAGLMFWFARTVLGGLGIVDVSLNPMSATLGALVIAIATEFSVLLSSRYDEEREAGLGMAEALRRSYSKTGIAVLASGVTTIMGFATLLASDIPMVRDFGLVTVLDLLVALFGVMIVLPAALVWGERSRAGARRGLRMRRTGDAPS